MNALKIAIAILRSIIALIYFVSFLSVVILFSVLTWRRWSLRIVGPVLRFFGQTSLKILGIPLVFHNEWPFQRDEPRVVIVNHQSTLDVLWFAAICPNRVGAVGKRELIYIPPMNLAWWAFRLFLIDRSNRESAIRTMKAATENTIAYQRTVALAPEGTRSKTGHLLPFKKGAFHLALEAKLPIYPVVMCGAAEAMPKHTLWAYPKPINLQFLPPVSTEDWSVDRLDEHIADVHSIMSEAYAQLREESGLPQLPPLESLQERP